jgi:hypothetical protein
MTGFVPKHVGSHSSECFAPREPFQGWHLAGNAEQEIEVLVTNDNFVIPVIGINAPVTALNLERGRGNRKGLKKVHRLEPAVAVVGSRHSYCTCPVLRLLSSEGLDQSLTATALRSDGLRRPY